MSAPKIVEKRREFGTGLVYRAYSDGTATYEMPVTVARSMGLKRLVAAMKTYQEGVARRWRAVSVRKAVLARRGSRATDVARELGITEARVRQIWSGQ